MCLGFYLTSVSSDARCGSQHRMSASTFVSCRIRILATRPSASLARHPRIEPRVCLSSFKLCSLPPILCIFLPSPHFSTEVLGASRHRNAFCSFGPNLYLRSCHSCFHSEISFHSLPFLFFAPVSHILCSSPDSHPPLPFPFYP
eukprot:jgi/Botrbrau1/18006/Bobra.0784s0002.1